MNVVTGFEAEAARRTHQTAIVDGRGRAITFGDLAARCNLLAAAWRARGIGRGDRVLVAMGLGIDLYVALAAAWRIGAVVVFPEPAMGLAGLRHAARTTMPKAFLAAGFYRLLGIALPELRGLTLKLTPHDRGTGNDEISTVEATDAALISFTSGSTGSPKAIVRSHGFLATQNARVAELVRPTREGEVDLVAFPVFVVANLALGVTSVLPNWNVRKHDGANVASITAHIRRHGVTRVLVPPSICERLARLEAPPPLSTIFTGGGPVFPALLERLALRLPGADVVVVYGSTEAEPIAHLHARDIRDEDRIAMQQGAGLLAGAPIAKIHIRLEHDEILVAGEHVNKGYLDPRHDAANKRLIDGTIWHRTGDAGRIDGLGRLWLLGRHEARVGTLYPFPVEVAAMSWPGVRRAALIGVAGCGVLAIEGDGRHRDEWQARADCLGDLVVRQIDAIPLDRRHRSKVDYAMLSKRLK